MGRQDALAYDGRGILRGMNRTTAVGARHIDSAMVKAIPGRSGGGRCWREGNRRRCEIANSEKINETYVGRVLRLTLLAPDIVEAILGGRQPPTLELGSLMERFPVGWREQREKMTPSSL